MVHRSGWTCDCGAHSVLGRKRSMDSSFLKVEVNVISETGFLMRKILGVFWPKPSWDKTHPAESIHPDELVTVKDILGVILPKGDEKLPVGVYELYEDEKDYVQKKHQVHNSKHK